MRRHRRGEGIEVGRFLARRQVAERIASGRAHQREVDLDRLVPQQFAAAEHDDLDEFLGGARIAAPAAVARIGEGVQADVRDEPVAPRGGLAQQRLDRAGRQRVGLDRVVARQRLHSLRPGPVPADDPLDHAAVSEAADAGRDAVADAERVDQRQVARMPGLEETPLERGGDVVGLLQAASGAAEHDERPVEDLPGHPGRIDPQCLSHDRILAGRIARGGLPNSRHCTTMLITE